MHANLAQGRAGLEPAGGLKPLRPMMGRGQPRPVQLSGFSEPFSFSVFFPGPAGLYAGHVLLYPAHAWQAFFVQPEHVPALSFP